MSDTIVKVGMAELKVARSPVALITLGLGSCVAVCLYDAEVQVIGMAHIMLPCSRDIKNNMNSAKFADTAIEVLIEKMTGLGASKSRMVAKVAGGAQMFSIKSANELMRIGERNVEAVRKEFKRHTIPIIAEDVGGNYGRTVELHSQDGALVIKTIGKGIKVI